MKPTTDKSSNAAKFHLTEPMSIIGTIYRNMGRSYLYEQKRLKDSCITKVHPGLGDGSQKLETWTTLHDLLAIQQVGECPFHVAQQELFQEAWLFFLLFKSFV